MRNVSKTLISLLIFFGTMFLIACSDGGSSGSKGENVFFKVSFETNGGSAIASITNALEGELIKKPTDPTKPNNTFGGWFKDADLTKPWDFTKDVVNSDLTLYAKWLNIYKVSFETNGGTAVAPIENVLHGAKITKPDNPTKTGFVFGGWFKEIELTTAWDFDEDVISANITLFAKWTGTSTFTVTFESNGGTAIDKITGLESGAKITKPTDPKKEGFVFSGWFKEEKLTTPWVFTLDVITANITLFAKWTEIIISTNLAVTFESNGGSNIPKITGITTGDKIEAPTNPTKNGSTFAGWFKDAELITAWDFDEDIVMINTTLYAKWILNTYTVSFVSNGGTEVEALENVQHGSVINKPTDPIKANYTLVSWHTNESLSNATVWNFATGNVNSDIVLYAKWELSKYTVSFDTKGGTNITSITDITHGTKITTPISPTKDGNRFDGWYKETGYENAWDFENDVVNANTTIFAKWNPNEITNETPTTATINGIACIKVPSGVFDMGKNADGFGGREVTLTKSYWISKYEITNSQYKAIIGIAGTPEDSKPISTNFDNVINFTKRVGGRLATEAEWEWAARGANRNGHRYAGGEPIDDYAWYKGNNSPSGFKDIGTKLPNELGIYDMSGNAWEWCSDFYAAYPSGSQTNPTGPTSGNSRVVRGGSYNSEAVDCQVYSRSWNYGYETGGIRVVFPIE